jgi:protein AbiQ
MIKLDNKPKHLTKLFYDTYEECKEILLKEKRQYCIALFVVDGIIFAIPFRTNINHKYSYIFKNSPRSDKSGLDFTKAVVITDDNFIGEDTIIDSKEYSEFINKQVVIANRFEKFIKDYKKWTGNPSYYRAEKTIAFSSLQYFYKELGLSN